jgi:hypothetical protein
MVSLKSFEVVKAVAALQLHVLRVYAMLLPIDTELLTVCSQILSENKTLN